MLQSGKEYSLKLVAGVSQFDVPVKVIPTEELIVESVSNSSTLYVVTGTEVEYAELSVSVSNWRNVDLDKINLDILDMYGNVVASKVENINESASYFICRMKVNKKLALYDNYTVRITYPGKLYVNQKELIVYSNSKFSTLTTQYVRIVDYKKPIIEVVTSYSDKAVEYKAELVRKDNYISMTIGQLSGVRPDDDGVFKLDFSGKTKMPLLNEGGQYSIVFSDKGGTLGSIDFNIPASDGASSVDQFISFYPPMLPKSGTVELALSVYGIDNGIMGTENVDIELVAEGEVYGTVDKSTIKICIYL